GDAGAGGGLNLAGGATETGGRMPAVFYCPHRRLGAILAGAAPRRPAPPTHELSHATHAPAASCSPRDGHCRGCGAPRRLRRKHGRLAAAAAAIDRPGGYPHLAFGAFG